MTATTPQSVSLRIETAARKSARWTDEPGDSSTRMAIVAGVAEGVIWGLLNICAGRDEHDTFAWLDENFPAPELAPVQS